MADATIKELLDLAQRVFDKDQPVDEIIARIDNYIQIFNKWYDANLNIPEDKITLSAEEVKIVRESHAGVLTLAKTLKLDAVTSLKAFQQKSEGIMAYTDTLPKKLSSRKTRKG